VDAAGIDPGACMSTMDDQNIFRSLLLIANSLISESFTSITKSTINSHLTYYLLRRIGQYCDNSADNAGEDKLLFTETTLPLARGKVAEGLKLVMKTQGVSWSSSKFDLLATLNILNGLVMSNIGIGGGLWLPNALSLLQRVSLGNILKAAVSSDFEVNMILIWCEIYSQLLSRASWNYLRKFAAKFVVDVIEVINARRNENSEETASTNLLKHGILQLLLELWQCNDKNDKNTAEYGRSTEASSSSSSGRVLVDWESAGIDVCVEVILSTNSNIKPDKAIAAHCVHDCLNNRSRASARALLANTNFYPNQLPHLLDYALASCVGGIDSSRIVIAKLLDNVYTFQSLDISNGKETYSFAI